MKHRTKLVISFLSLPIIGLCGFGAKKTIDQFYTNIVPEYRVSLSDQELAMSRATQIMDFLKSKNFGDFVPIPGELATLPDQKLHETDSLRSKPSFYRLPPTYYKEAVFWCSLYARTNMVRNGATNVRTSPEGFYIVGYRDGSIKKIPIMSARISQSSVDESVLLMFPGEPDYDPNGQYPGQLVTTPPKEKQKK